jgi:gamma-glutamyltranspeptidase/glutathione hydrolase
MAVGAAGSRRIISSLVQTISAIIDFGETIQSAIAAPRIHGLLTGAVRIERPLAEEPITEALKQKFGRVVVRPALDFGMAAVQGLHFHTSGAIDGAADPRRDGVFERKETCKR